MLESGEVRGRAGRRRLEKGEGTGEEEYDGNRREEEDNRNEEKGDVEEVGSA
jgi:hypothetical protein